MKAILALEDGKSFLGEALYSAGNGKEKIGEVIFNTAVVGYQEMMTDPANAGKILVLTYPLIGNYGCAPKFNESKKVWLSGLLIKENSRIVSNWQARTSFDEFVKAQKLLVMKDADTRSLAAHLRQKGQMLGLISTSCFEQKELVAKIKAFNKNRTLNVLTQISVAKPTQLGRKGKKGKRIAVLDLGITASTLRQLEALGLSVTLLPYNTSSDQILRLKPHGLIISNGPEEDVGLQEVVANVKPLIGRVPILGISTGLHILASALGAKVVKMKLGHHGLNYPLCSPTSYKGEITAQNHSYVVDANSLQKIKQVQITACNLNDRTIEEVESKKLKFIGAQYCPLSPGCGEVNPVFKRFIKLFQ